MEDELDSYFARRMAVGTECAWLESTMSPTFVWNKILDNTESDILHLIFDPARALRELGLLLADGVPTVQNVYFVQYFLHATEQAQTYLKI